MSSTRNHSSLQLAVVSALRRSEPQAQPEDATAAAILSFERELRSTEIEGLGVVYFYDPPSVSEREAYQKHLRYDGQGLSVSMLGIVDGIIARVRDKSGRRLFGDTHRARLLELPAARIMSIWQALGGENGAPLSAEMVEAAAKK